MAGQRYDSAMRDDWEQPAPTLVLGDEQIATLIAPAFPGARVRDARRVAGGLSNATWRVTIDGRDEALALRVYVRSPESAALEQAICAAARSHVEVPETFHFAPSNPYTHQPYAVAKWIEGITLAEALQAAGDDQRQIAALATDVGHALAGVTKVRLPTAGFLGTDAESRLYVVKDVDLGGSGIVGFATEMLTAERVRARVDSNIVQGWIERIADEAPILDELRERPAVLVHSDFDATNILIRDGRVAAVLDWEFAYSGSVVADVGHILRPPAGVVEGFESALIDGFVAHGGTLPRQWRRQAQLLDLTSWLDFLGRPNASPKLIESAIARIEWTLEQGDDPVVKATRTTRKNPRA